MTSNEATKHLIDFVASIPEAQRPQHVTDALTHMILTALLTVQDVVRVKGLVWSKVVASRVMGIGGMPYCRYIVDAHENGHWIWFDMWLPSIWHEAPSLDAAKAACQEHYEKMVMHHLELIP